MEGQHVAGESYPLLTSGFNAPLSVSSTVSELTIAAAVVSHSFVFCQVLALRICMMTRQPSSPAPFSNLSLLLIAVVIVFIVFNYSFFFFLLLHIFFFFYISIIYGAQCMQCNTHIYQYERASVSLAVNGG